MCGRQLPTPPLFHLRWLIMINGDPFLGNEGLDVCPPAELVRSARRLTAEPDPQSVHHSLARPSREGASSAKGSWTAMCPRVLTFRHLEADRCRASRRGKTGVEDSKGKRLVASAARLEASAERLRVPTPRTTSVVRPRLVRQNKAGCTRKLGKVWACVHGAGALTSSPTSPPELASLLCRKRATLRFLIITLTKEPRWPGPPDCPRETQIDTHAA